MPGGWRWRILGLLLVGHLAACSPSTLWPPLEEEAAPPPPAVETAAPLPLPPVGQRPAAEELSDLRQKAADLRARLQARRAEMAASGARYHGTAAAIVARLRMGTPPGNPILLAQCTAAQSELSAIGAGVADLSGLAAEAAQAAARASALLGLLRADPGQPAQIMAEIDQARAALDGLLAELNEDIGRHAAYLAGEQRKLATLILAVRSGAASAAAVAAMERPLVTIRFDRPYPDYGPPLSAALSQALAVRPEAHFEIVAVTPVIADPAAAQQARADIRDRAEEVLRRVVEMGVPADRVRISALSSPDVLVSEVRLYLR